MRYRLRTLLIVLAVLPPVIAGAWWYGQLVPLVLFLAVTVLAPLAVFWDLYSLRSPRSVHDARFSRSRGRVRLITRYL